MRLKLTSVIVDKRLLKTNSSVKRIGEYIDSDTKIDWQCMKCNKIWKAFPPTIIKKYKPTGCPECGKFINRFILTNKIIDQRLLKQNRLIKRIGNVIDTRTKINWECLVDGCSNIWSASPNHILKKKNFSGCPKCGGNLPLSNKIVDDKIKNRSIKRIGNYINNDVPIEWMCKIENCEHIWSAIPDNVLNKISGCPLCKNKNEKLIYSILKENNINFEHNKDIRKLNISEKRHCKVDFYFPKQNLIIEYNGHQHYQPTRFCGINIKKAKDNFIKQQERDKYIYNFCEINNIQLLVIDGRIYKNNILQEYIYKIIRDFK